MGVALSMARKACALAVFFEPGLAEAPSCAACFVTVQSGTNVLPGRGECSPLVLAMAVYSQFKGAHIMTKTPAYQWPEMNVESSLVLAPVLLFWQQQEAVTAIEYALLASLIAMIALVGIAALGGSVGAMWMSVSNEVSKVM